MNARRRQGHVSFAIRDFTWFFTVARVRACLEELVSLLRHCVNFFAQKKVLLSVPSDLGELQKLWLTNQNPPAKMELMKPLTASSRL
ncbi:uncharacterized protein [Solanum lycopersicum]|uniref:uncharacterized protein isoform X2 n=1 Tax=Solanum lycopersicum TaxID=4081 RepID=UPI0037497D7C